MNLMLFTALLVRNRLVDRLAFEDPEGWDGGVTESRAAAAYEELFPRPPAQQDGETPRTDEIAAPMWLKNGPATDEDLHVMTKLCRTLERELLAKQAEVDMWKEIAEENQRESISKTEKINLRNRELESLKAAQGWRPISEEMPEDWRTVNLFSDETGEVFSGYYDPDRECWEVDGTSYAESEMSVSHWMPLPTPPVDRSENKG
jgi:hypothetical protein